MVNASQLQSLTGAEAGSQAWSEECFNEEGRLVTVGRWGAPVLRKNLDKLNP